jgi:hypothetical protein
MVLASAFASGLAHADAARDVLEEITRCADVTDAAERLKCYDAAAPRAKSALTAPVPEAREKSLLEWFGLSRPAKPAQKPEEFGKPPREPEGLNEITATVVEFAKTVRGKALFILDNGQIWRQLDADATELPFPPVGTKMKVTIETGFLGSYNLTIEGRNALIKVFRVK